MKKLSFKQAVVGFFAVLSLTVLSVPVVSAQNSGGSEEKKETNTKVTPKNETKETTNQKTETKNTQGKTAPAATDGGKGAGAAAQGAPATGAGSTARSEAAMEAGVAALVAAGAIMAYRARRSLES